MDVENRQVVSENPRIFSSFFNFAFYIPDFSVIFPELRQFC
jgi:hypothetical protein